MYKYFHMSENKSVFNWTFWQLLYPIVRNLDQERNIVDKFKLRYVNNVFGEMTGWQNDLAPYFKDFMKLFNEFNLGSFSDENIVENRRLVLMVEWQ